MIIQIVIGIEKISQTKLCLLDKQFNSNWSCIDYPCTQHIQLKANDDIKEDAIFDDIETKQLYNEKFELRYNLNRKPLSDYMNNLMKRSQYSIIKIPHKYKFYDEMEKIKGINTKQLLLCEPSIINQDQKNDESEEESSTPLPPVKTVSKIKDHYLMYNPNFQRTTNLYVSSKWFCTHCSFNNEVNAEECQICCLPKASGYITPFQPQPGKWFCSNCLFNNQLNAEECQICCLPNNNKDINESQNYYIDEIPTFEEFLNEDKLQSITDKSQKKMYFHTKCKNYKAIYGEEICKMNHSKYAEMTQKYAQLL